MKIVTTIVLLIFFGACLGACTIFRRQPQANRETTPKTELENSDLEAKFKSKNYPVIFVDRSAVFPVGNPVQKPDPLMLVVEVSADGKLSVNKEGVGTMADLTPLSIMLKRVFAVREQSSLSQREVIVDPRGKIKNEDLEKLVEMLVSVKASPIRIIKNEL